MISKYEKLVTKEGKLRNRVKNHGTETKQKQINQNKTMGIRL